MQKGDSEMSNHDAHTRAYEEWAVQTWESDSTDHESLDAATQHPTEQLDIGTLFLDDETRAECDRLRRVEGVLTFHFDSRDVQIETNAQMALLVNWAISVGEEDWHRIFDYGHETLEDHWTIVSIRHVRCATWQANQAFGHSS